MRNEQERKSRLRALDQKNAEVNDWITGHKKILETIRDDHQLLVMQYPYKIHFAVDFHDIHEIVFPIPADAREVNARDIKQIIDKQVGRICLFYGLDTLPAPVLLPPYRDEAGDFLVSLSRGFYDAIKQWRVLETLRPQVIDAFKLVGFDIDKFEKSNIDELRYDAVIDFIKNYFYEFTWLITGAYENSAHILASLFKEKRLVSTSSRWPTYIGLLNEYINKVPIEWLLSFHSRRRGDERAERANYRDAQAIHIIKSLNEHFRRNNNRELVLLFSSAGIFKEIINNSFDDDSTNKTIGGLVATETGESVHILRTPEVFQVYLYEKEKCEVGDDTSTVGINKRMLDSVNVELRRIDLYLSSSTLIKTALKHCGESNACDDCIMNGFCDTVKKAEDLVDKFLQEKAHIDSLNLANKFNIYMKNYSEYESAANIDYRFKTFISFLKDDRNLKEKIENVIDGAEKEIQYGFEQLQLKSMFTRVKSAHDQVIRNQDENFFRIETDNSDVNELIRILEINFRMNNNEKFFENFKKLEKCNLELANKSEYYETRWLVAALVSRVYGIERYFDYFLNNGLNLRGKQFKEFAYLEAISLCRKKAYTDSENKCLYLIQNYPEDPRFPYFCGYIMMLQIEDERAPSRLSIAIEYFNKSMNIMEGVTAQNKQLLAYIYNNLVYAYSKMETEDSLRKAEVFLKKLENISEREKDWGVNIWHTVGNYYVIKANIHKGTKEEIRQILVNARIALERAKRMAWKMGRTINSIERDMKRLASLEIENINRND